MNGQVIIRASFPQGWRGNKYEQDEKIPATDQQAARLTRAGVAYYDFEEVDVEDDLTPIPYDELLKPYYFNVEDVKNASDEELLSIEGLGEKRLQEIREYFNGE